MRNHALVILFCMGFFACRKVPSPKPVWMNGSEKLFIPVLNLQFKASGNQWKAVLLSFTQPIPLQITYNPTGFLVSQGNAFGVVEGPAQLVLKTADQSYYYPVWLTNKATGPVSQKDYRSPKTVNPDSSLVQQSQLLAIDFWRNLQPTPQNPDYFYEYMLQLKPVAATYRALKNEPITAYYVQPGSCTRIPINGGFNKNEGSFWVTVGPLKDAFQNLIANGTRVIFKYQNKYGTWLMESVSQNGFSTAQIPGLEGEQLEVSACIQQIESLTLKLTRP